MARNGSILDRCGPFADGDRVLDLTKPPLLHAGMPRAADCSPGSKMLEQFLLQHPTGLDEQAAVDRLVRHLIVRLPRVGALEPASDLLRRPFSLQLHRYCAGQG